MNNNINTREDNIFNVSTGLWYNNEPRHFTFPLHASEFGEIDYYFLNLMTEIVGVSSYQKIMESNCSDKERATEHLKFYESLNTNLLFIKAILHNEYNAIFYANSEQYIVDDSINEIIDCADDYIKEKYYYTSSSDLYDCIYYFYTHSFSAILKRIIILLKNKDYLDFDVAIKLIDKLNKSFIKGKINKIIKIEKKIFHIIKTNLGKEGKLIWLKYVMLHTIPFINLYENMKIDISALDFNSPFHELLKKFDIITLDYQNSLNQNMLLSYSISSLNTKQFTKINEINTLINILLQTGLADDYVCKKTRCFAIMKLDGNSYASLSGISTKHIYPDVLANLKKFFYDVIISVDNTKYYYDKTKYISYEDYVKFPALNNTNNNRMFSCCERKILAYLEDNNLNIDPKTKIYVRFNPCYMCDRALSIESVNPEIIYYKNKKTKGKKIHEYDRVARHIASNKL